MTVSGSGRTREKDTRAPARGPFCVLGSSLAGEEGVLLQGGLLIHSVITEGIKVG